MSRQIGGARYACLLLSLMSGFLPAAGCASSGRASPAGQAPTGERTPLKLRARECLTAAIRYPHNPVVRVEAVEALESAGGTTSVPWIREALGDEHPAVRFAACVAVGRSGDAVAMSRIRERMHDADPGVQVGAMFALHRLGDASESGRMSSFLLQHKDVTVRRNAAFVLGLLDEPSAVRVLARAMTDRDPGVRQHALEAMARLGNREARMELVFMTNAGVGTDETFAVQALSETGDPAYVDTFRYRLGSAPHLETRLAASKALGKLGIAEGYDAARRSLQSTPTPIPDLQDPVAGQRLRVKQLAAAALGAIGRAEALPVLEKLLEDSDPRLQVSAARAILEILGPGHDRGTSQPIRGTTPRP